MSTLAHDWHDVETELVDRGFTAEPHRSGHGHTLTAHHDDADIEVVAHRGNLGELWRIVLFRTPRATGLPTSRVELPASACTAFALAVLAAACAPLPTTGPTSRSTR